MVRKLRTSAMSHKGGCMVKEKFSKNNFLVVGVLLFFVSFMVIFTQDNSPTNLVKITLQNRYHVDVSEIYLERVGLHTYRMTNAPTDPITNVRLENWKVVCFGTTGVMSYVESLDVPIDDEIKQSVNIRLTDEQYHQLQSLADEQGISLEQALKNMLLQELQ